MGGRLEEHRVREHKKLLFALLQAHTGDQMWILNEHLPDGSAVYMPVKLMCRSGKNKDFVVVKYANGFKAEKPIHILFPELPEGYSLHTLGRYHGLAVKCPLFNGTVGELK